MGEDKTKKFKVKIRLNASLVDEELHPEPKMNISEAVQDWWDNGLGKEHFEKYLNDEVKNVRYKSYLKDFEAGDSVDKETYD